jgi:hypothetical protein
VTVYLLSNCSNVYKLRGNTFLFRLIVLLIINEIVDLNKLLICLKGVSSEVIGSQHGNGYVVLVFYYISHHGTRL